MNSLGRHLVEQSFHMRPPLGFRRAREEAMNEAAHVDPGWPWDVDRRQNGLQLTIRMSRLLERGDELPALSLDVLDGRRWHLHFHALDSTSCLLSEPVLLNATSRGSISHPGIVSVTGLRVNS